MTSRTAVAAARCCTQPWRRRSSARTPSGFLVRPAHCRTTRTTPVAWRKQQHGRCCSTTDVCLEKQLRAAAVGRRREPHRGDALSLCVRFSPGPSPAPPGAVVRRGRAVGVGFFHCGPESARRRRGSRRYVRVVYPAARTATAIGNGKF